MHLKARHPSGMMRIMVTEVEGFKSASVWIGLLHQRLKKKMTPCLLLDLIHSVPQLLVFMVLFYNITSPVDPFPGFLVLTHIYDTCSQDTKPSQGTSRISATPSLLPTPPPTHSASINGNQPPPSQSNTSVCLLFAVVVIPCCRQP